MGTDIKITFKDGTVQEFKHVGRAGGSYTKQLRFEGAFAIVRDEWDKETAFPADDIKYIEKKMPRNSGW